MRNCCQDKIKGDNDRENHKIFGVGDITFKRVKTSKNSKDASGDNNCQPVFRKQRPTQLIKDKYGDKAPKKMDQPVDIKISPNGSN